MYILWLQVNGGLDCSKRAWWTCWASVYPSFCLQPKYIPGTQINHVHPRVSCESTSTRLPCSPQAHSISSGLGTLGTCGTQSHQTPGTIGAWDWQDSVVSAHQVPWGLAGLIPFRPPGTLWAGRAQSFQPPRYPIDGGTQSFQAPWYPEDWWDSVL